MSFGEKIAYTRTFRRRIREIFASQTTSQQLEHVNGTTLIYVQIRLTILKNHHLILSMMAFLELERLVGEEDYFRQFCNKRKWVVGRKDVFKTHDTVDTVDTVYYIIM
uniref:Uncharacterized protein n=1 Tax=Rhizophagus irregularis (strain DAOM 181602 / DAOM 197198 / MUCL 43194) TaxID=747089 RepID=U9UWB1_RHIID